MKRRQAEVAANVDALRASDDQVDQALSRLEADVAAQQAADESARQAANVAERAAAEARRAEAAKLAQVAALDARVNAVAVESYVSPGGRELLTALRADDLADVSRKRAYLELGQLQGRLRCARRGGVAGVARHAARRRDHPAHTRSSRSRRARFAPRPARASRSEASRGGGDVPLATVRGITVNSSIADNLESLLAAAEADGFVFGGGGYRSSSGQVATRRSNCGTSDYAVYEIPPS